MTQIDWGPLRAEIAKWQKRDLVLPLWWRDDDATDVTDSLERLIQVSKGVGVPVHLAIVPRNATSKLGKRLADEDQVFPIVHGWAHRNHAPAAAHRSEFSDARAGSANREDASEGLRKLARLLPGRVLPVFVPPWNHIDPQAVVELPAAGFQVLSTCDPRPLERPVPSLSQVNTHLDPIAWRDGEVLHDVDYLMAKLVNNLKRRRQGKDDNTEPFGLLTHHLAMREPVWDFVEQFWQEILKVPHEIATIAPPYTN